MVTVSPMPIFPRSSRKWRDFGAQPHARAPKWFSARARWTDRWWALHQPVFRESMGQLFNLLTRIETGLPFRDTQCGFKLFKTGAAREVFHR